MRLHLTLFLWILGTVFAWAQKPHISGQTIDKETQEAVGQATIQLLKTDSTFVTGAISNENGLFSISVPSNGKYLLKITSVGYTTTIKRVEISQGHDLALGKITLSADAVMLKGTTVTANVAKVVQREDTFVYNSAAYRTPEGSVVEELVKRLPGAQIDDSGNITINGKKVEKIKVDGKEFMTGDTKTALKNLPTSIVNQVKAYDEKSDLAKVTGIDDGNEKTVLDFGLKKGMNKGLFANADASVGTHDRYAERLMGAYFNDKVRVMGMGNFNNTNDMGFPGGGGRGRWGNNAGLNASKMTGLNFNYDDKNKLELDGSVRWNHSDNDTRTTNAIGYFDSSMGSYSNSFTQSYSRSNSWDARARLEWKPDTLTDIMFRPQWSHSTSDNRSWSNSAAYKDDPYNYVSDPLSDDAISQMAADSLMVNTRSNTGLTYSEQKQAGAMLQLNRRLNNMGRNVTLRGEVNYSTNDSKSLSTSNVHLYQVRNAAGADSVYQTNRYSIVPNKAWNYSVQTTYSEPLWRATFLQFSYQFKYSFQKSDRSTYDFSDLGTSFSDGLTPVYRNWDGYLGRLTSPFEDYLDTDLSKFSEYQNYTHELQLMFRMIRQKYQLNAGVMVQPQRSHFTQDYLGTHTDTTRTVTNVSPTLDFRYRFNQQSNLRIRYRGSSSQPSMSDLLDITDDSDPLNIRKGNPGLKPSFTNSLRVFYNNYIPHYTRFISAFLNFQTTRNAISDRVTYDEVTGSRVSRPENINGNWSMEGRYTFNTALDTLSRWNVSLWGSANYQNMVGYVTVGQEASSVKNTTRNLGLMQYLSGSFRNSWIEVSLNGSVNYNHVTNKLQSQNNLDTWAFSYGLNVQLTAPWGTSLSSDLSENSRRGYNDAAANTNELLWNLQIAQSFLKGKPLTVRLEFYDLLHEQSSFSRNVSTTMRSDTWSNAINSYAMLHVSYRLNLFGNKESRRAMRGGPGFGRGPGGRPGPPPGGGGPPPGGGFGGPR